MDTERIKKLVKVAKMYYEDNMNQSEIAKAIGVSPELILALMYTESRFDMKALSPTKQYKGLMQTPWASKEYADVDVLYGARILEEKMKSSHARKPNGVDMRTAIAMYKGGLSRQAFSQADEVLRLYNTLRTLKEAV